MNKGSIVLNFTKYNRIRSIKTYTCWSCKQNVTNLISNLFCSNCKVLQRPEKLDNYFQVLGVKETYDLNDSDLARNYKDLQKHLHPDKYANRYVRNELFKSLSFLVSYRRICVSESKKNRKSQHNIPHW